MKKVLQPCVWVCSYTWNHRGSSHWVCPALTNKFMPFSTLLIKFIECQHVYDGSQSGYAVRSIFPEPWATGLPQMLYTATITYILCDLHWLLHPFYINLNTLKVRHVPHNLRSTWAISLFRPLLQKFWYSCLFQLCFQIIEPIPNSVCCAGRSQGP